MREDEEIACRFLESLQVGPVTHEPEGFSLFPDFSVGGSEVGVEVRRLNRNYVVPGQKMQGFENAERSILDGLRKVFREAGPSVDGECWHVDVRFQRPVTWADVRRDVMVGLSNFKAQAVRFEVVLSFAGALDLHLTRASKDHGAFFFFWIIEDEDAACNVLAEVERNLRLCIDAKESKVVPPIKDKYAEWWLVLVNRVDRNINVGDYATFGKDLDPPLVHPFHRVYLIDPFDFRRWVIL